MAAVPSGPSLDSTPHYRQIKKTNYELIKNCLGLKDVGFQTYVVLFSRQWISDTTADFTIIQFTKKTCGLWYDIPFHYENQHYENGIQLLVASTHFFMDPL
jgi:hypothetical protein